MDAIKLNIAEPCHANWQNMTDTEKGRFCSSCKKEVIDFTLMNNNEVYKTMLKGENDICGRFLDSQLNTEIEFKKEKKQHWHKYFFSFFIPTFLFSKQSVAQKLTGKVACVRPVNTMTTGAPSAIKSTDIKNDQPIKVDKLPGKIDNQIKQGEVVVAGMVIKRMVNKNFELSGSVIDAVTFQKVDASIIVKNSGNGTTTDGFGHFKLKSRSGENIISLSVSANGYETQEMNISIPVNNFKMNDIVFYIKPQAQQLDTIVVHSYITKTRKDFTAMGAMAMTTQIYNRNIVDRSITQLRTVITDSLKVYPSPVSRGNILNVDLKLKPQENYVLQIIEATGKVVFQKQIKTISKKHSEQLLTDSRWSNGNYFVRVIDSKNKLISTSRFIVE